jgi:hypothetical protein
MKVIVKDRPEYRQGAVEMQILMRQEEGRKSTRDAQVCGNFLESALGAGNDFIGPQAFENLRKFVQVTANYDGGFLVAVAGALGDEKRGLDVVRGNDDEMCVVDARVDKRAFLFGIIDDHGFARTNEVIHGGGIFLDQDVSPRAFAEVIDETASQMAAADNNDVVSHLAGEHAASLLRIVALQCLKNENGDNNSKQNALPPEGIQVRKRPSVKTKINSTKKSFTQRQMVPMIKRYGSQQKPQRQQRETPAALAEKKRKSDPEESTHENPAGGMLGGAAKQVNAKM